MGDDLDPALARAMLEWQIEMGATDAIGETPVDRLAAGRAEAKGADAAPPPGRPPAAAASDAAEVGPDDPVAAAHAAARAAPDLPALREAIAAYPHCELRRGARNVVFADGVPGARVMIVGEAPGRDEDIEGLPFVGRSGKLLDLMLAAIGLSRHAEDPARAAYITNVMPWRPPQNRDPKVGEIAMMKPFLERHVELARPEILVPMGNPACAALLGTRGIMKLRGTVTEALGRARHADAPPRLPAAQPGPEARGLVRPPGARGVAEWLTTPPRPPRRSAACRTSPRATPGATRPTPSRLGWRTTSTASPRPSAWSWS